MPNILIDCPRTGKPMATGLAMSPESFASSKLEGNEAGPCPHCGQMHLWGTKEAYLEGARPAKPKPDENQKT